MTTTHDLADAAGTTSDQYPEEVVGPYIALHQHILTKQLPNKAH